ncbi:MAG: tripartite tricarboxylate transporter substrate-binding protein [Rubrivivax sp.]
MHPLRRRVLSAATLLCGAALSLAAVAQTYPSKPITLVVPFAAGGPTDVVARLLGSTMTRTLGQTVVIENKLGAGGTIAANAVRQAPPDGYTFLIHHNGMGTAPALYRKLPFNPLADFEYVSQVVDVPMTLLGRKDFPPNNFRELVDYLKANRDKINVAHAGLGAVSHLCSMLFRQAIGVDLTTVPFSGTGPALNALLGGQVDMLCDQTTTTTQHIKAGSVKLYGVTTSQRLKTMPEVPTLAEQGLTGFQVVVWHGIYAPKGTPKAAMDRFGAALSAALKDPGVASKLVELGAVVVPDDKQTPAGLQTWLQAEIARYGPVIRAAGQFAD